MADQRALANNSTIGTAWPLARTRDLVTTEARDELLVYDTRRHHIHHLNHTAASVWRLCDGQKSLTELAVAAVEAIGGTLDVEIVRLALTKLDDAHLLQRPLPDPMRVLAYSRRRFLRRAAVAGAVALPSIASMTAPTAAAAQSVGDLPCTKKQLYQTCNYPWDCCSEHCTVRAHPVTGEYNQMCDTAPA